MSGIAAVYYRDGRPASRGEIERVARVLGMYGRERQLIRVEGSVAFAYAHFTDTPEARGSYQPLTGGGGRYTMVFDGRLDNRTDVARELSIETDDLRLLSDAQLAMQCWERWGEDSYNRWVGNFALINWDKREARLIAARDQFGRRTLHFHQTPQRLVLASAPKCIHALGDVPREVDEQKIADALSQLYHDGERTFFKGIKRIPAGCSMTVEAEKSSVRRYYNFRDHIREVRYQSDDDYVEAARELFQTCVKANLRSVGPVGAFMSGGLDSSTMSIFAARMLEPGKRLPTFTSVPEPGWDQRTIKNTYGDETPHVKAIAEHYPAIEINLINSAGAGHYHKQEELLHALDMPVRNALNFHWAHGILEQAKTRGISVMLGGDLGNASLSYSGEGVFTYLLRQGDIRQLYKELALIGRDHSGVLRAFIKFLVHPLCPTWLWDLKEQIRGRPVSAELWRRIATIQPSLVPEMQISQRVRDAGNNYHGGKPMAQPREAWIRLLTSVMTDSGDIVQGLRALYGIDVRDPFSDRRLLEWSFGLPENQFYRNRVDRWLIKRMMDGELPDSVLNKKTGLGIQTADWHLRMTRDLPRIRSDLAQMLHDPDLARMIDIPRVQKLLDDWPEQTVVDVNDDRFFLLPTVVPMTMQVARFVQREKGVNLQH